MLMDSFRNGLDEDSVIRQGALLLLRTVPVGMFILALCAIFALPVWVAIQGLPAEFGIPGWGYLQVLSMLVIPAFILKALKFAYNVHLGGTE